MTCPYCHFPWEAYVGNFTNDDIYQGIAPILCEECGEVSLVINGKVKIPTEMEMEQLKKSPAYELIVQAACDLVKKAQSLIDEAQKHFDRGDPLLREARKILKCCKILGKTSIPPEPPRPYDINKEKFGEYHISFTVDTEKKSLTAVRIRLDLVEITGKELSKPIALGLTQDPLFPPLKQFILANATQKFDLLEEPKKSAK